MALFFLTVNWFGIPEALSGSSDAEMRKVPKWAQGSFQKIVGSFTSAGAATASALVSMSKHQSASLVIGGVSQTYKQRRDYTTASLADDKGWYRGSGNSGSMSIGLGGKGGSRYDVLDENYNIMWSSVHSTWNEYYQAGKVLPNEVKYNNPRKTGKSKATSTSAGLTDPPGSPL